MKTLNIGVILLKTLKVTHRSDKQVRYDYYVYVLQSIAA